MPIDYSKYPADWKDIRVRILERAGDCCEGSPAYPDCRAENHEPHPETGSMVVLTIAHLDHDTTHNDDDNLRALCRTWVSPASVSGHSICGAGFPTWRSNT